LYWWLNPLPYYHSGENYELKAELNSGYAYNRKDAVKKVIANMTIGKDASPLFADVVKNMQTDDIEMKKLVYLYLINYAKTQPELVILAVNTFVKVLLELASYAASMIKDLF
jgi:AP-1 complex subunit beta-1